MAEYLHAHDRIIHLITTGILESKRNLRDQPRLHGFGNGGSEFSVCRSCDGWYRCTELSNSTHIQRGKSDEFSDI